MAMDNFLKEQKKISDSMMLAAILIATIYWVLDSILNIFFSNKYNILAELIGPDLYDVYVRVIVLCLFIIFGSHAQSAINTLKKAKGALLDNEERFRTMANFTYHWEYWIGPDGKFVYISPSCERVTGYHPKEFLKHPELMVEIIHPDDRERVVEHIKQETQDREVQEIEYRIVTPLGDVRWIGHICQSVQGMDDRYLGKRVSNRDITIVKQEVEERQKVEQRLSRINESFLSFGSNALENINRLTALCGELLGATCAVYNRLEYGVLYSCGQWNTPDNYNSFDHPEGQISYDVIKSGGDGFLYVSDIKNSGYGPKIPDDDASSSYSYVGKAVKFAETIAGSLCVVFQKDYILNKVDKRVMSIIASAIGVEEERKRAEVKLEKYREHLEDLIKKRTVKLLETNENLKREIKERKHEEETRKSTQVELKETSILLETIFNTLPDILGVQDVNQNMIRYNSAGYNFFNKSHKEVEGKKCYSLFGNDSTCEYCPTSRVLETGKPFRMEKYEESLDVWFDARAYPIVNDKGDVVKIIEHLRDITEEKKYKEALLESEEKYRLLVENAGDAIFIMQNDMIKYSNSITKELTKTLKAKFDKGFDFINNYIHPKQREKFIEWYKSRLRDNTHSNTYSFSIINDDGIEIWFELNVVIITWEGKPAALNFLKDISNQKRLEAQVHQAQRLESIGTLAGGIAHDFNNLLMGIQGSASVMLLDINEGDPHYENVKLIERCIKSGALLTKQLLGFARRGKYVVKPADLNEVANRTSIIFGRTRKEITIHRKYLKDLLMVEVDVGQIEQVLLNLYVNAWQAMPGGGDLYIATENVTIDESYSQTSMDHITPGKYAKISVTDNGIGMDEQVRQRIFEPFFTTRDVGAGTGLGLASAYGIIKNHKGIINCYSEKYYGTTFNIYIPASDKKLVSVDMEIAEQILKGTETILLVDDEEVVLNGCGEIMKNMGYQVLLAPNGQEALNIYEKKKGEIGLVILDLIMPTMNGGEVYDRLKKMNPEIKVLLSSGYSINSQAADIIERGCNGFIQKPYDMRQLSHKIRGILDT